MVLTKKPAATATTTMRWTKDTNILRCSVYKLCWAQLGCPSHRQWTVATSNSKQIKQKKAAKQWLRRINSVSLSLGSLLFFRRGRRHCCSVFHSVSCIFIITKLRLINRCIGLAHSRSFNVSMRKYCVCVCAFVTKKILYLFLLGLFYGTDVCVFVYECTNHTYITAFHFNGSNKQLLACWFVSVPFQYSYM